jgi:photosystem II stability/assembly factor-like uncharacterized protein
MNKLKLRLRNIFKAIRSMFPVVMFFVSMIGSSQGNWERVIVPTVQDLNALYFTDSLYGWVVGDSGTLLHTADGGDTWQVQQSQTINNIEAVYFIDRDQGWASSHQFAELPYGTELLKTSDGGETWTKYDYPEDNIFINTIFYHDSLNGWMGGSPHAIVKTTDGGFSWEHAAVDTSTLAFFPVLNMKFWDSQYGYASGGIFDIAGVTWRTHNGGEKWYAINPVDAPADEVRGLHLFDSITVIGSGGDPDFGFGVGMLRTYDGGYNWDYEEQGVLGIAYDIGYRNETEAWAPLGHRQKMLYSLDGGDSWTETDTPDSVPIYKVMFPDSLHGYAVGRFGAMIRYIPPDPVSVGENPHEQEQIILRQNFPNPFTDRTSIQIRIPAQIGGLPQPGLQLKLGVTDIAGNEIDVLWNNPIHPGTHEFQFIPQKLKPGIYFLCLSATQPGKKASVISIKKMVKLD